MFKLKKKKSLKPFRKEFQIGSFQKEIILSRCVRKYLIKIVVVDNLTEQLCS